MSSKNIIINNNTRAGQFDKKETDTAIPSSVSSSSSSSVATISTHRTDDGNSNERDNSNKKKTAAMAFVEKGILDKQEGKTEGRTAPLLPETITSSDTSTGDKAPQRPTTTNHIVYNNIEGVVIKSEDSLTANNDANNNPKRKQDPKMPIKSEEVDNNDDAYSHTSTRQSSGSKQKQYPSEGCDYAIPNDNHQTNNNKKRKRKNNQQGRQHTEKEPTGAIDKEQKDNNNRYNIVDNIDNNIYGPDYESDSDNINNICCLFCKDPNRRKRIYYKCGTVLSKYFPKSNNNPNPGWYKGTIRMHHITSPGSGSDYGCKKELNSSSEEENDQQSIIFNEIHYDDGDVENVSQDDLKLDLTDICSVRILHSSPTATASNSKYRNRVVVAAALPILSNKHDQKWLGNYQTLNEFKAENGHCRVPQIYGSDPSLGKWVHNQRSLYKKGKLPEDRVEKLDKIGFDWNPGSKPSDQAWLEMYDSLKQFKAENGHCRVPSNYGPDPSLGAWVMNQRNTYKQRKLAEDRVEKLDKIGFDWNPGSKTSDQAWLANHLRLKKFKDENGHCRVPQRHSPDPPLGKWVTRQRGLHKKGTLAEDRVKKLNKIGFEWVLAEKSIQTWDEMFGRLEQFKEENGHCRVPQIYDPDPSLGNWVQTQRIANKKGKLPPDCTEKLNKIGFDWDPYGQAWDEMFGRLEQFKTENGHCRVPQRHATNRSLGKWVQRQRMAHKNGSMAPNRVAKLDSIGFEWGIREAPGRRILTG